MRSSSQLGTAKITSSVLLIAIAIFCSRFGTTPVMAAEGSPLFRDSKLPLHERVDDLLSRLTLEEKISLLQDMAPAIPRLGIPAYNCCNEALHGVVMGGTATVFPQAIGLAATWDPDLVRTMASAISDEARAMQNQNGERAKLPHSDTLVFYSPVVNLARDPRWGRTQETYGEDPYLAGRLGTEFVKGLQGDDPKYLKAIATPKHFAVYSKESGRGSTNAIVPEDQLRDYYLVPFRECVGKGHAASVMSSYTAINGIPSTANRWLLTDVLRGQWGFKGYVVSDEGAVTNVFSEHHYAETFDAALADAFNAGLDVDVGSLTPECCEFFTAHLLAAAQHGLVKEAVLNRAVANVLRARFLLGLFDPPNQVPFSLIPASIIGSPEHVALARQLARESIVLLKNSKVERRRPLLPLDPESVHSIAVVGPIAAIALFGNYSGNPANPPITPIAGIRGRGGSKIAVKLVPWSGNLSPIPSDYLTAFNGRQGLLGEYFDNETLAGKPSAERIDQEIQFALWGWTTPVNPISDPHYSVRWTGQLTPAVAGEYQLGVNVVGEARLILDGEKLVEGATGILTKTVFLHAGHSYSVRLEYFHHNVSDDGIRLVWKPPAGDVEQLRKYDAVIAVLGLTTDDEDETKDRTTLTLPAEQQEFIKQVVKANPRTVVLLENGSSVAINWIKEHVPAILETWYPGEQGGNAIADVLFGDYNPAGRLPITFYASDAQLPPMDDYDISKGRTYMYSDHPPLYPFGYGLSYTKFRYKELRLSSKVASDRVAIRASVDIENVGLRDADEVVQVYIHKKRGGNKQPRLQLKAFQRIHLQSGEIRTVTFSLQLSEWAQWDTKKESFVVTPGMFNIWVGASSADIRLEGQIRVPSGGR
jgi:beta-glucosidase